MAIDRTSKVAFAELHPHAKRVVAAEFLRRVLDKLPYHVHTVLTDKGVQFTPQPHQFLPGGHSFDPHLPRIRRGAPPDQTGAPVDQRPGRTHEPHH